MEMVAIMREPGWMVLWLIGTAGSLTAALLLVLVSRWWSRRFLRRAFTRLLRDSYMENIWELASGIMRHTPQVAVENSLRAEAGGIIKRPFGSPRRFLHFDHLVFSPAQLVRRPTPEDERVDLAVTIGPCARRPLRVDIPILVSALGYGVSLSAPVKIAIARGAAAVGTATNSGEGPLLPEERQAARHLILQFHRGKWDKELDTLRQADAIEIWVGQGASAGVESRTEAALLPERAKALMGLRPDEDAVLPARMPGIRTKGDWRRLVDDLKAATGGVPIGMKLVPSGMLEADLDIALEAGVDFITLDGAQAGTKGSAPILQDDFGLPTLFGLCRAVRHLERRGVSGTVSLLIAGGLKTPGECLKAIALGADAVYLGSTVLFAAAHNQIAKTLPWEPPTELVFAWGKLAHRFDPEQGARHVAQFLRAYAAEIEVGIRALGKRAIGEVGREDLVALEPWTAQVTGIPLADGSPTASPWLPDPDGNPKPPSRLKSLVRDGLKRWLS